MYVFIKKANCYLLSKITDIFSYKEHLWIYN